MGTDRRRNQDNEHDVLEQKVADLAVAVIGLRGALDSVGAVLKHDVEGLREEIDVQRALSKYSRRTHFQVQYWVAIFALQVGAGLHYFERFPWIAGFLFWIWPYGPWQARVAGFVVQAIGFWYFWHAAQVPDWLFNRVPASGPRGERPSLYNRVVNKVMGRVA